jgi:hypothetical protein
MLQEYCKHTDSKEKLGTPSRLDPNGNRYSVTLDEVAGIRKELMTLGKTLKSQPPISKLIMNVAYQHLLLSS